MNNLMFLYIDFIFCNFPDQYIVFKKYQEQNASVGLHWAHSCPRPQPPEPVSSLTPSEKNSMKFQAASILQPTGQLTEVTAVQIQSDSQGLSAAFHLVTHWCVCNQETL